MEASLKAFHDANAREPWAPGKVDCCMVLADWAIWLGHIDPAEHMRGTYSDEAGFFEIIDMYGGLINLVASRADLIGERVTMPSLGAIGVVGSRNNIRRQFGAIHDGRRWLVRTARGFDTVCAAQLAAWRIPCLNS